MQNQNPIKANKLERANIKLASYISTATCVLVRWSTHKDGLEYSILKKEYCFNYNIQASNTSIKIICTVKQFDKEYTCELIKTGSIIVCSNYFSSLVNKRATQRTEYRTFVNTKAIYKPKPTTLSEYIQRDYGFDLYCPTIILDCNCEKCHPKKHVQKQMTNFFHRA